MRDIAAAYDKTEKKGKTAPSFQFMRLGYFCLDNKDCTCLLYTSDVYKRQAMCSPAAT